MMRDPGRRGSVSVIVATGGLAVLCLPGIAVPAPNNGTYDLESPSGAVIATAMQSITSQLASLVLTR